MGMGLSVPGQPYSSTPAEKGHIDKEYCHFMYSTLLIDLQTTLLSLPDRSNSPPIIMATDSSSTSGIAGVEYVLASLVEAGASVVV